MELGTYVFRRLHDMKFRAEVRDFFEHHPDRGGDAARMAEINAAYRKALP